MSARNLTLTVEQLNEYVRRSLAGDPMLHDVRLRGELSNFKRHVSGHWYFTLKDSASAINCAMFRSAAATVSFAPRDGQQVVLYGSVGLYAKTGQYQFYVDGMEPDGLGELFLRFEALKAKLAQEGLFDAAMKKPLPLLPKGVGIVTSKTGAVIHDIMRVAWRRDASMPLYLLPVSVQGQSAAREIAAAIRVLDRMPEVDVLIVGRGGGSMEDLWPFNEEAVARAIARCKTPVVSAVGHETDFTIADFAADLRAATPSAAAELVVPQREALLDEVTRYRSRMKQCCEQTLSDSQALLSDLRRRLSEQTPERKCAEISERIRIAQTRIAHCCQLQIAKCEHRVAQAKLALTASGPQATLKRGYAIVKQDGRPLQSITNLQPQARLAILLKDGAIDAEVISARKEENPCL